MPQHSGATWALKTLYLSNLDLVLLGLIELLKLDFSAPTSMIIKTCFGTRFLPTEFTDKAAFASASLIGDKLLSMLPSVMVSSGMLA